MVCRTTAIGSAMTSLARLQSGLEDQQTLSTYHDLLREHRTAPTPSTEEVQALLNAVDAQVDADPALTPARRESLHRRVTAARTQPMTGAQFHAALRIGSRTERGAQALADYVTDQARLHGTTEAAVRGHITGWMQEAATAGRTQAAPREWLRSFAETHPGLPLDRQTAYALYLLDTGLARSSDTRRTVTRTAVTSHAIAAIGYDAESGRLEVEMHSRPGQAYAYRVPASVHADMMNASSLGQFYTARIRGNPDYQYPSAADADADAVRTRCCTCGQFAGPVHACPVRDSDAERAHTVRLARAATRPTAPEQPAVGLGYAPHGNGPSDVGAVEALMDTEGTVGAEAEVEARALDRTDDWTEPTLVTGQLRTYRGEHNGFRSTPLTALQQAARTSGTIATPIEATVRGVVRDDGQIAFPALQTLRGWVDVTYLGRGRGYEVRAHPADLPGTPLRCTCADYQRNYDCEHVAQAVQDVQTRINQDRLHDPHATTAASAEVRADLARAYAESRDALAAAQDTWSASPVSYSQDPEAFQTAYAAAKARIEAGQSPVALMRTNATDGLGARGTGRGFGVEIEFDVQPGRDRSQVMAAIGRDLHAAGLTRTTYQVGYHDAARRGYSDNHQGGWSFEADCTVAGEIVSPIMYDEPETWANLERVCQIVRDNGGIATTRTGGHVHVSTGDFDHTVANHNRLMSTFRENEDLLYRLSASPDRGTHRGPQWCAPNRVPAAGYTSVASAAQGNYGHNVGINMQAVRGASSDHVEFRTWDQTLDPAVIQTQIKVSLAITQAAFRDTEHTPGPHSPLGSTRARNRAEHGPSRRLTGDAWRADTASFRALADRLFRRPEDKAQMAGLFAGTKWQRVGGR